ncbi:LuxR C-terminal-related transcriptional regulator [Chloroflexi bacterium TSY]|nr:LuxR C-terminal-related transcriptional regulator [Chloroflexi bacterium TSY]
MSTPILATKLYIPAPRPNLVSRPHLIKRLNEGLGGKLTLISAPAGFGKTTLVNAWVNGKVENRNWRLHELDTIESPISNNQSPKIAWLSLDEGDNDSIRFLAYLVAALQTTTRESNVGAIGERMLSLLQSPQPPSTEAMLTTLLNEITTRKDHFVLILDDYHLLDAKAIDNALTFLLDHLPSQMHLVVTTREDPQLPLARYRARGQLTELRAADLRFTLEEATGFLNEVMDLNLEAKEIAALETRTEGWIAGLQMAALALQGLSMQRRTDIATFIQAFTGSHRFVLDYLAEEVLQRQPEPIRRFLLQTAILDRLSGPLCDAVTEQEDGQEMLIALERGNLFVVPLDDERQWYRYHHLFADVLRAYVLGGTSRLRHQVPVWHQRASAWYERNGLRVDAVHHALAAADFEHAAGLVELAWPAMHQDSLQNTTWFGWVKALPNELVRARPVLSVGYAWALLDIGKLETAEARLRDAERWLDAETDTVSDLGEQPEVPMLKRQITEIAPTEMVVADEAQFRSLPVSIVSARAYIALALGDVSSAVLHARRVLELSSEGDFFARGDPAALLGVAYWISGDLKAASQTVGNSLASYQKAGNIVFAIAGTFILADIKMAQGRLREAIRIYEHTLQLAMAQAAPRLPGIAELYLGLGELHREQGNLEIAAQYLQRSEELDEPAAFSPYKHHWCLAQARMKQTQGELDDALNLLDEAERLYIKSPYPDLRPLAALKTRVWIQQDRLDEVLAWAYERGLSVDDDLSYLREFEHITLARVLIAQYKSDQVECSFHEAMGLLVRLLQAAEAGGRTRNVIEILMLQAIAYASRGDISPALVSLERALMLAKPESYVQLFVNEGLPMVYLLREAAAQGMMPDYTSKLLSAFNVEDRRGADEAPLLIDPAAQLLIEPLSQREREILQLIAQGLSNREISEQLFLTLDTVKGHNRRIFGKLQVKRRTEAVARARELGLL